MQAIQEEDQNPAAGIVEKVNRGRQHCFDFDNIAQKPGGRARDNPIEEADGCPGNSERARAFLAGQVENSFELELDLEHLPRSQITSKFGGAVVSIVASKLADENRGFAGEIERRLTSNVPAIFQRACREPAVQWSNRRAGRDMPEDPTLPGPDCQSFRHLRAESLVVGSQRSQDGIDLAPLDQLQWRIPPECWQRECQEAPQPFGAEDKQSEIDELAQVDDEPATGGVARERAPRFPSVESGYAALKAPQTLPARFDEGAAAGNSPRWLRISVKIRRSADDRAATSIDHTYGLIEWVIGGAACEGPRAVDNPAYDRSKQTT